MIAAEHGVRLNEFVDERSTSPNLSGRQVGVPRESCTAAASHPITAPLMSPRTM
jgi:hypothetical protein